MTGSSVKVGSTPQVSGTTSNDFTSPVTYTVTAKDGSTQNYTVTVSIAPPAPPLSSSKSITNYGFLKPAVAGTIIGTNILVTTPWFIKVDSLIAFFSTTGVSVNVGATPQVSGTTVNNFTSPVTYTVTAQDSSTQNYTVTVTPANIQWTDRSSAGSRNWQSIASSSDGSHLAAVVYGGDIWTSSDGGAIWTDRNGAGSRYWVSIASSADGSHLAAVEYDGDIWTSSDGGATWTDRSSAGSRSWLSIASSSDGSHLAAVVRGGDIWTSSDGGATWTDRSSAGTRQLVCHRVFIGWEPPGRRGTWRGHLDLE